MDKFKFILDIRLPQNDNYYKVLVIKINKTRIDDVKQLNDFLRTTDKFNRFKFIGIFDQFTDINKSWQAFWRLFNNIDAKRDLSLSQVISSDHQFTVVTIDATRKLPLENGNREWPNDIIMTDEIISKVNEKWSSYGFSKEDV